MRALPLIAALLCAAPAFADEPDRFADAGKAMEARDFASAARMLRPLAEAGDAEAQYRLGMALADGRQYGAMGGVEGVEWLERAALQGHENAVLRLAFGHQYWPNHPFHRAELVRWLEYGVEAGFPWAMSWLAGYFHTDTGLYTGQDHERARALYQAAADAGHGHAMVPLARMLMAGEGGPADGEAALHWLDAARAAQMRFTEWPTGELFHYGAPGVEPDLDQAAYWYMQAAREGLQPPEAWSRLSDLYEARGDRARAASALDVFSNRLSDPHRPELAAYMAGLRERLAVYHTDLTEAERQTRQRVTLACLFNDGVCD
ncbi:sel1 repeat family protein [Alkalicaulis satelles]|uniref:Sel1 repeat family protein n=1 Tax=Alkalicaulis satelles TaxID=2609175 RepID=A0A5M6ZHS7_9PROT|nr:tetratricopeptide repeat protein [Alkalicaulis satelles]KAA5803645.1 sel1 repeat family protein [Alkalicaulis satelles]